MSELLLSCQRITKAYSARPLFEEVTFGISAGDHIGLVGPNGSGKSTLLRILAGLESPDTGSLAARRGLRVGTVPQDPVFDPAATPAGVVRAAIAMEPLEEVERDTRAAVALSRAGFEDAGRPVGELSGGWHKRLAIARELAREPELLLLDEPTNHLDLDGIAWLEQLLAASPFAFLTVSHDRYFLENVASRMMELSRVWPQGLLEVDGPYSRFLAQKDALLSGQASYQDSLANKVRREMDWLAHKARARTRKAQARVDEAARMAEELEDARERAATRTAGIEFTASGRRTKELLVARDASAAYGARVVVRSLSLVLSPGLRLGLVGPNGSGKTTVLRLLAGSLAPDTGTIDRANALKVVQFEQGRASLDPERSLRATLAEHGDTVRFQDRPVHVAGWAKRFLFTAEQLEQPVGRLSGGEQARVLLARLMLEPADLLLLDEPTNDLDIPTLEVLEESLLDFNGALVLVTHDRYLLDRVATRVLALDGEGGATLYADYAQWEAARARVRAARPPTGDETTERRGRQRTAEPAGIKRLSYRERLEWEGMEAAILAAEAELEAASAAVHDPAIASDAAALHAAIQRQQRAQSEVDRLYARWATLESQQS